MLKIFRHLVGAGTIVLSLTLPVHAETLYLFSGDRFDDVARDGSIHRFKFDGQALTPASSEGQSGAIWDQSQGQAHKGRRINDIVIAPDGDVYAASRDTNSVLRFDGQSGTFKGVVVQVPSTPDGLVIGPDGNLYIASNSIILRCSLAGKPLPGAEQTDNVFSSGGRLVAASGLAFGPDGHLYVASQGTSQILRYDGRSGVFLGVFCAGNLVAPSQIAFGPDGDLYVASTGGPKFDTESGYVARFDGATGAFRSKFAADAKGALGLVFAPNGDLLVSDYWTSKITRYDAKTGQPLGVIASSRAGEAFYYLRLARQSDKAAPRLRPVEINIPRRAAAPKKSSASTLAAGTVKGWKNALVPKGTPGPLLTLASRMKTDYVLLLPSTATPMDEKAAAILAWWLGEMTGAKYPLLREGDPLKARDKIISIGRTTLLQKANLPQAKLDLGDEGYAIAAQGDTLFLLGGKTRGAIYAAYALLEEDLGCRWYARGSAARIPRIESLRFRPTLRHYVPTLEIRDPFYIDAFDADWSLKNKTNSSQTDMPTSWGGNANYGGFFVHTFNRLVPPDKYFKEHPEYFAEVGGKRQPSQLDLSNPDVLRIVVEEVKKGLQENPAIRFFSVSPNDGRGYCECTLCSALDTAEATAPNSKSPSLIKFVNKVAEAIEPEFPAVRVSTLAYLDTFTPPKTIRPRKNVAIQLCTDSHAWKYQFCFITESQDFQTAMKAWNAVGADIHIWDYTADYVHWMVPLPNMPVVTDNMRFYLAHGAKGIMLEGDSSSPGGENSPLRSWVWAKQMWDPSLDTRALMRDFIYGYYGEAAEPIWQYNMMLWQMWEAAHKIPHRPGVTKVGEHPLFLAAPCSAPPDWSLMTQEYLDQSDKLFARAEALAKDADMQRRVQVAKLPLLYVKLGQGLGYIEEFGSYVPGTWINTRDAAQKANYLSLLQEVLNITADASVTHASAFTFVGKLTDQWQAILDSDGAKLPVLKLSGQWKFKTDPEQIGVAQNWATQNWAAPQTEVGAWSEVASDRNKGWESQGFPDYKGTAWYRQKLVLPADFERRKHLYLYFGSVDSEAEVFINGIKAFEHTIASTGLTVGEIWNAPFAFDAAPFLKAGEANVVAVRVTSGGGVRGVWKPVALVSSSEAMSVDALKFALMMTG